MIRTTIAIILLLAAGGIFFFLTDPLVREPAVMGPNNRLAAGGVLALRQQQGQLREALANAGALQSRLSQLQSEVSAMSAADLERLETFIPTANDATDILVDLEHIADGVGLNLRNTQVVGEETMANGITEVRIAGTVTGNYRQLELFLNRLAGQRRPLDVTNLSFEVDIEDGQISNIYQINFTVRTYQLK